MRIKIGRESYEPKDFVRYATSSLVSIAREYSPDLVDAYWEYTESEKHPSNFHSVVYKPFKKLKPKEALLRSLIQAIQANGNKNSFANEAAKRFEFMLFKYNPEMFEVDSNDYFVEILHSAKDMKKAAQECTSCVKDKPLEFFENWALDPGTVFAAVFDEKDYIHGYFRGYFYEDRKDNLVIGIDTVDPNKKIYFHPGKWDSGIKLIGFAALASFLPHCDYVLCDPRLRQVRMPSKIPCKYHTSKLEKLGEKMEKLYSHGKHYVFKRNKALGVNCFSEYFHFRWKEEKEKHIKRKNISGIFKKLKFF